MAAYKWFAPGFEREEVRYMFPYKAISGKGKTTCFFLLWSDAETWFRDKHELLNTTAEWTQIAANGRCEVSSPPKKQWVLFH